MKVKEYTTHVVTIPSPIANNVASNYGGSGANQLLRHETFELSHGDARTRELENKLFNKMVPHATKIEKRVASFVVYEDNDGNVSEHYSGTQTVDVTSNYRDFDTMDDVPKHMLDN